MMSTSHRVYYGVAAIAKTIADEQPPLWHNSGQVRHWLSINRFGSTYSEDYLHLIEVHNLNIAPDYLSEAAQQRIILLEAAAKDEAQAKQLNEERLAESVATTNFDGYNKELFNEVQGYSRRDSFGDTGNE